MALLQRNVFTYSVPFHPELYCAPAHFQLLQTAASHACVPVRQCTLPHVAAIHSPCMQTHPLPGWRYSWSRMVTKKFRKQKAQRAAYDDQGRRNTWWTEQAHLIIRVFGCSRPWCMVSSIATVCLRGVYNSTRACTLQPDVWHLAKSFCPPRTWNGLPCSKLLQCHARPGSMRWPHQAMLPVRTQSLGWGGNDRKAPRAAKYHGSAGLQSPQTQFVRSVACGRGSSACTVNPCAGTWSFSFSSAGNAKNAALSRNCAATTSSGTPWFVTAEGASQRHSILCLANALTDFNVARKK